MTIADSIKNILNLKNNNNNNNNQYNNNINHFENEINNIKNQFTCSHKLYSENDTAQSLPPPTDDQQNNDEKKSNRKVSKVLGEFIFKPSNKLCRENVEKILKEDPILHYIIKEMMLLGCLPPVIKCEPCEGNDSYGSYTPFKGVQICDNIQTFPLNIRNTVVHEYIHAYDICKNKFDTNNCEHIACTEIRAANLSGDCKWKMEAIKKNFGVVGHQAECAKRRATGSLKFNPLCRDTAEDVIKKVWSKCNEDFYPFSSIPRD